jgi:hypothetical protein
MVEEEDELDLCWRGEEIYKEHIDRIWRTLTNKPLPKIDASILQNSEFNRVLDITQTSPHFKDLTEWEYGIEGINDPSEAFVFYNENGFHILIKRGGHNSIEYYLRHELNHILRDKSFLK